MMEGTMAGSMGNIGLTVVEVDDDGKGMARR